MKILVSDNLSAKGIEVFNNTPGFSADVKTGMKPDELKEVIGEYDGIAIRSATKLTEDVLEVAKNLKVIGRAGTGLDRPQWERGPFSPPPEGAGRERHRGHDGFRTGWRPPAGPPFP